MPGVKMVHARAADFSRPASRADRPVRVRLARRASRRLTKCYICWSVAWAVDSLSVHGWTNCKDTPSPSKQTHLVADRTLKCVAGG